MVGTVLAEVSRAWRRYYAQDAARVQAQVGKQALQFIDMRTPNNATMSRLSTRSNTSSRNSRCKVRYFPELRFRKAADQEITLKQGQQGAHLRGQPGKLGLRH